MIKTTSQLLSHHKEIEEKQSQLYQLLAEKYPHKVDVFEKLSRVCLQHRDMAQRAYREGVTDAFEVGFLVNPLNPKDYELNEPSGDLSEDLETMIGNEETVIRFCNDAASNSSKLLPDVPETFERLIKMKKRSITALKEMF